MYLYIFSKSYLLKVLHNPQTYSNDFLLSVFFYQSFKDIIKYNFNNSITFNMKLICLPVLEAKQTVLFRSQNNKSI